MAGKSPSLVCPYPKTKLGISELHFPAFCAREETRHWKAHWETYFHQVCCSTLSTSSPALDTSLSMSFKACWGLQSTELGHRSLEKMLGLNMGTQKTSPCQPMV